MFGFCLKDYYYFPASFLFCRKLLARVVLPQFKGVNNFLLFLENIRETEKERENNNISILNRVLKKGRSNLSLSSYNPNDVNRYQVKLALSRMVTTMTKPWPGLDLPIG